MRSVRVGDRFVARAIPRKGTVFTRVHDREILKLPIGARVEFSEPVVAWLTSCGSVHHTQHRAAEIVKSLSGRPVWRFSTTLHVRPSRLIPFAQPAQVVALPKRP